MNRSFRTYRKITASILALLIVTIPFLKVGGHSAFRFDVTELKLYFFGGVLWMDEFFVFLIVTLIFSLLFLWVTIVFGRVWCGWGCPQVILTDLTQFFIGKKRSPRVRKAVGHLLSILLILLVSANLIWYFLSPYEFFERLIDQTLPLFVYQIWVGTAVLVWVDIILLGKVFCARICPYARFQSVLYDENTLTVAYIEDRAAECIECKKCVKECPVGIDIRDGQHFSCVACAQCIDACDEIFEKKDLGPKSLIHYTYGESNQRRIFKSWARVATGGLTILMTGLLILLLMSQVDTEIDIIKNNRFKTRINKEGQILNAYQVSMANKIEQPARIELSAMIQSKPVTIKPDHFTLQPDENLRKRVVVTATPVNGFADSEKIVFTVRIIRDDIRTIKIESNFDFKILSF